LANSLKKLFDEYYTPLCNYATSILDDKHIAEDVVQSIFVRLWEKEKLFSLEHPQSYLLRCVKYKCIDHLRQRKRRHEISYADLPDMDSQEDTELTEEDIIPLLNYFAAKLPPKMKEVFLLSREKGLTYNEIAEQQNISVKTVGNLLCYFLCNSSSLL